MAEGDF